MSHADPLTLAAEIEKSAPVGITLTDRGNCLLIAAALRLAEAYHETTTPCRGEKCNCLAASKHLPRMNDSYRSARGGR